MLRSFRFRLALIAGLMSGLVLIVFGSVAWWSLSQSRLEMLDAELQHFGYRVAIRSGQNVDTERLQASLVDVYGAERAEHRFFTLLSSNGEKIVATPNWPLQLQASDFAPGIQPLDPQPNPEDVRRPNERAPNPRIVLEPRIYTTDQYRIGVFANSDITLVLAADLSQYGQDMHQLRRAFLAAAPGALLIVAIGAAFVAWRALRPVETLGRDMRTVSAQDLSHRLEVDDAANEFQSIIESYNEMLGRLERSFHQATRFSADASHELKTPLAIMQGTLERGFAKCQDADAQMVFAELLEQTGRQGSILESLLLLSRADAGRLEVSRESIDLSQSLKTWIEDASLLAEARNISVRSEIEPGITIQADPILFQRVAHNLFSNAVRYNRDGGEIVCCLAKSQKAIEWSVSNTGEPIQLNDRERIFERFVRTSPAAAGDSEGAGLGLSLTREIIVAHGGSIELAASDEEKTEFVIHLPC